MSFVSFLLPKTIAQFSSEYNADIRIVEYFGRTKLLVNGSPQSGPYIASLWKKVLRKKFFTLGNHRKNILVLGVGGATVIHMIRSLDPGSAITAVDIDPVMINIARKYFSLNELSGVTVKVTDASDFVRKEARTGKKYEAIIVDLFIGRHIPDFVLSDTFLNNLKVLLGDRGNIIFNYLREREYGKKSEILLDKLRRIYHSVNERKIFLNRFFVASNS